MADINSAVSKHGHLEQALTDLSGSASDVFPNPICSLFCFLFL